MGAKGAGRASGATVYPSRPLKGLPWKDGGRTRRFIIDIINRPMAVAAALFVVVTVNAFLYFGYYAPPVPTVQPANTTTLPGESTGLMTTPERTSEEQKEEQRPQETTLETIPSRGATTTAPTSASASASAFP
jgi:hypothetical protein